MDCLFCRIVSGEIPSQKVLENDHAVAFKDVRPVAPTHVLVVPRKHVAGIHDFGDADAALLGELMLTARRAAEKMGLLPGGYRLVVNQGPDAGQSVFHVHVHVLGGRQMAWPPG